MLRRQPPPPYSVRCAPTPAASPCLARVSATISATAVPAGPARTPPLPSTSRLHRRLACPGPAASRSATDAAAARATTARTAASATFFACSLAKTIRCATLLSSAVRSIKRTSEATCAGLGHSTNATTPPEGSRRAPTTAFVRHRSLKPAHSLPPPSSRTGAPPHRHAAP
eukprot:7330822-Prymnesium_polylepis.1